MTGQRFVLTFGWRFIPLWVEFYRLSYQIQKAIRRVRLFQIVVSATFNRLDSDIHRAVSGHQDHFSVWSFTLYVRDDIDSVAIGQAKIGNNQC